MTIDDDSEVLIGYFASSHGEANQGTIVQCPGAVPRSPRVGSLWGPSKKKSTQVCAGEPHPAKTWRFKTWGCKNYYWLMLLCHSLQYYCTGLPTSYLRMLQTWTREKNAQYCFFFFPLARANKPDGWITGVVFLVMGNGRTNKGCVYVVFDEHNRMEQGEKQRIHSYQWRNTCSSEIPIC